MPQLHNWLAGERWLEDVPAVYEDPKSAAIANKRGSGKRSAESSGKAKTGHVPEGYYAARIMRSEVKFENTDRIIVIIETEIQEGDYRGHRVSEEFKLGKAFSYEEQASAQGALAQFSKLVNGQLSDSSQLVDKDVVLGIGPNGYTYDRLAPALRVVP